MEKSPTPDNEKLKAKKESLYHRPCSVCGSEKSRLLFMKDDFRFVKCKDCGFVYVDPSLRASTLKDYYEETKEDYWKDQTTAKFRSLLKKKFNDELAFVEKCAKKGKVLDIGCGAGIFLYHAKSRGWKVYGTEFNKFSRNFIKSKLHIQNIFPGNMDQFKNDYFELVTIHQCFEHLPDPNKMLDDINRILQEKGVLFISVPNIYGITTRILGKESGHFDIEHLNYFNRKNFRSMLEKHGFEVLSFKTEGMKIESVLRFIRSKLTFNKAKKKEDPQVENKIISKMQANNLSNNIYFRAYYYACSVLNLFLFGDYLIVLARKKKKQNTKKNK